MTSNNPLLQGLSGTIGKTLVIRQTKHGIVVASPPRKVKRTHEANRRVREKFTSATRYANEQMRNWETKRLYQDGVNKRLCSAYQVAVSDFLRAPIVDSVETNRYAGTAGHQIDVFASDDFMVTSVEVIIRNEMQQKVEQGQATRLGMLGDHWVYVTETDIPIAPGYTIEARARDIPGNIGSKSLTLQDLSNLNF